MEKRLDSKEKENPLGLPERSRNYSLLWISTRNFHKRIRIGARDRAKVWIVFGVVALLILIIIRGFFN